MDIITKLFRKSLLFLTLLILTSLAVSKVLDSINESRSLGYYAFMSKVRTKPEIVILGASRARDHYVTPLIEEKMGRTAYNFGTFGSSVLVQYSQLLEILKIYKPKLIIYEINGFDYSQGYMSSNLEHLKLFPNNDMVNKARQQHDDYHVLRSLFCLYKYNQSGLQDLWNLKNQKVEIGGNLGFHSLTEAHLPEMIKHNKITSQFPYDYYKRNDLLAEAFQNTLEIIKQERVNLVFVQSPYYKQELIKYPPADHGVIKEIQRQGFPYYDFNAFEGCDWDASYYYDLVHLTEKGANIFTTRLLPIIEKHL